MYNILTCDDEQIMIDSLQFIIKKNFEGQVNLFSALSGSDAVSIVSREKIDIIFMDINMPGMSGLDAISCIKSLKPSAVIIVLSAFDKFQYAQEAMNIGAYKYITKPVNRSIVIQTVRNAMNLVDERNGTTSGNLELQKKLDIVYPMIESDFIYSCIFSKAKNEDFQSYLDYFNMKVDDFFFACIEVPDSEKNIYEVCSKVRKIVSQKFKCLAGLFMTNRIAVFVSMENSAESLQDDFHSAVKEIFTLLTLEIGQKLRVGISNVCGELEEVSECAAFICNSKEEKENPLIKKVFGYIQEHIAENFSLDDAASFAGVSSFYLSKLFKEETGETFINYVTDRRLEKGRIMLCETELSIKEISAEIGYNDQNYFSRIFKNKFGISPTDFRNTNRNSESL